MRLTWNTEKTAIILSRINTVLTVVVLLTCGYIALLPYYGTIQREVKRANDTTGGLVYETRLAPLLNIEPTKLKSLPQDNRLVIPKILVDGPISEGSDKTALDKGYWRRTEETPLTAGNMVIAGHRNIYSWTLYDLDKLNKGDLITVYWQKKEYNYKISSIFEVLPNQIEIESNTDTKQLTIYTCTPILTAEKRLVVTAIPYEI